ncbi:MAG: TetR/AcrR family transcriptional regulator [Actinomycetales bacterium]|nr:TetR/AcrR family transcriptional regulator [Actinomycetales bacterium]
MALPEDFVEVRVRARPMAPDDRRDAILDAVIPLIKENGRDVSTRQMAEAADVAEGTLFRAFGDKESILRAAIERFMDPEPLRNRLRAIDPDDPTEQKVREVLAALRERFEGVIGFTMALGLHGPLPRGARQDGEMWLGIVSRMFGDDELAVPVETLAYYLRLLAFGSSIPMFNQPHPFDTDELVDLALHGALPHA